jgi:hypothetical protein
MNHLLILLISIPCVLGAECQRGDTSCSCETDTGTTAYFSTFKFISKSENNAENTYSAKCGISRNQCGSGYTSKIPAPTCCKNCCKSTECKCKAELCIYPKCPVSSKPFTGFTGKEYNNKNHNELTADKCGCGDSNLKQCLIGQICSASTTKPKTCNCCSKGGTVTMNGQCTCKFLIFFFNCQTFLILVPYHILITFYLYTDPNHLHKFFFFLFSNFRSGRRCNMF